MTSTLVLQTIDSCENNPISLYSNVLYANYHSYDIAYKHHTRTDYSYTWNKVLSLLDELYRKCYEYIYVLSNTSVIKDIRVGLNTLMSHSSKSVLMYKEDSLGTISNNGFLVHNTEQSREFFTNIIQYVDEKNLQYTPFPDRDKTLLGYFYPKWIDVIDLCPQDLFNLR